MISFKTSILNISIKPQYSDEIEKKRILGQKEDFAKFCFVFNERSSLRDFYTISTNTIVWFICGKYWREYSRMIAISKKNTMEIFLWISQYSWKVVDGLLSEFSEISSKRLLDNLLVKHQWQNAQR